MDARFYNTGSDYIPLAAGTYSVILGVRLTEIGNSNIILFSVLFLNDTMIYLEMNILSLIYGNVIQGWCRTI